MRTLIRIDRKTLKITVDVEDGVGTECQTKNAGYYERIRKVFGLPATAIQEQEKPELYNTETQAETLHE